ncbi:transglutaminase-like domain-containing protein [Sinanaerobacter chloroacetimidivorans]|jgi:transglutaminase-like putative cysteine protease|uniref:Transglutaminase domain-containing protein n=1 Tax=Sinanaerobacter chloroacetimidivorans TaxID=2818044 RepID=A0A8J7W1T6_9FIRM|nr:transglutaminase-like domain-containing protein [Sinanaerobacter chloroacetimidivorans]MBR0598864.1 transglutaminase domain-containing protein [Sinanaerobacter chloroacetimidivorans]
MKQRILFVFTIAVFLFLTTAVSAMAEEYFDTKDIDKGLIHVTCDDGGKLKVMIQKGDKKYTYDLNSAGETETFPLQLGNGSYKVSLLKNTSGSAYKLVASKTIDLKLTKQNAVYLTSIQNINWKVDSKAVKKAAELTKDEKNLEKKASILWNYMVKNNSYDYNKLATLSPGYIPVVDKTYTDKTGICYDFASLYAAMLRSQGTPAKLVKGYAPKNAAGYHAWNEVYDEGQGKWVVIDTTYDLQILPKNPKVSMIKNSADFNKVYEY